jgi:hypothetical protein
MQLNAGTQTLATDTLARMDNGIFSFHMVFDLSALNSAMLISILAPHIIYYRFLPAKSTHGRISIADSFKYRQRALCKGKRLA